MANRRTDRAHEISPTALVRESAEPGTRVRAWTRALAVLSVVPILSGCILDRVFQTHRQLCDVSPPEVAVVDGPGGAMKLVFSRPTLTIDDIGWLVGVKPTRVEPRGDEIAWIYSAAPSARPASQGERSRPSSAFAAKAASTSSTSPHRRRG